MAASRAAVNGSDMGNTDLFSMPANEAAKVLNRHLWWDWYKDLRDSLISWTSSLPIALQFGFYRHANRREATPNLSDIKLCVLDTSRYPAGTFLRNTVLIGAFMDEPHPDVSNNSDEKKKKTLQDMHNLRTGGYRHGEYLSQGVMDIRQQSSHASFEQLIGAGLYTIFPDFQDSWHLWANRVKDLRSRYFRDPIQMTDVEMLKTVLVARCFSDEFVMPVAAMLVGLRKRQAEDDVIVDSFLNWFSREFLRFLLRLAGN